MSSRCGCAVAALYKSPGVSGLFSRLARRVEEARGASGGFERFLSQRPSLGPLTPTSTRTEKRADRSHTASPLSSARHARTRGSHLFARRPETIQPRLSGCGPKVCPLKHQIVPRKKRVKKSLKPPFVQPAAHTPRRRSERIVISPMVQGASHTHTPNTRRVWEGGLLHAPFPHTPVVE